MLRKAGMKKFLFLIIIQILLLKNVSASIYYVSPDGTASWSECTNIETPCSLATANNNAKAGDVVYLRGGVYNTMIYPKNSGTPENLIVFQAYPGENPVIGDTTPWYTNRQAGIMIQGKSYIKVDGITVDGYQFTQPGQNNLLLINQNAHHIEITNCTFRGNKGILQTYQSTHLWLHHNTFTDLAVIAPSCDDWVSGLQLGAPGNIGLYSGVPGYNTIENNVFAYGGHHNLETFTFYNVIRNNYFHNEGWAEGPGNCTYGPDENGKYGNRNIQIYDGTGADGTFNLVEGNRFGHSGPPSDDDGGDGFTLTAPKNIVRYNSIFNSQNNGILMKLGWGPSLSDNNRIYQNTIYKSGRYKNSGPQWQGRNLRWYISYGTYDIVSIIGINGVVTVTTKTPHRFYDGYSVRISGTTNYNGNYLITRINSTQFSFNKSGSWSEETTGKAEGSIWTMWNVIKNNILYSYGVGGGDWSNLGSRVYADNLVSNNFCTDNQPGLCSVAGNPLFLNPDVSDPMSLTLPDLRLQPNSPAIDGGTHLTIAKNSGSNSTILVVEDALYFQDGTWGSDLARGVTLFPDWIAIGSVNNVVQIKSIDYSTNTITLSSPTTWQDGDRIWLYKKSDGQRVLYGSAPDYGAYEYVQAVVDTTPPAPPTELTVI